jgi:YD repeat-containing protein
MFQVTYSGSATTVVDEGSGCTISGPYTYYDQSGAGHDMNLRIVSQNYSGSVGSTNKISPPCNFSSTSSPSQTVDGSMLMNSRGTILYPDGTAYISSGGTAALEDTNGNLAYLGQDSLGRSAFTTNIPIGQSGPIPVGTYSVTTTSATGQSQPYSVSVGTATIGTVNMPHPVINSSAYEVDQLSYCGLSAWCPNNYTVDPPAGTVNVIKSISLPNQTSYTFTYDPNYATIQKIVFPTGGYVRFVWGTRNVGNLWVGAAHVLSTIVVTDVYLATASGATESHWKYTYSDLASSNGPLQSGETAPDGTATAYSGSPFFYSTLNYSPVQANQFTPTWQETQRTISNSGTMVQSVATIYAQGNGYGKPALIATSMYDGSSPLQKQTQFVYDSYGNVTEQDESDWYSCTGSPCTVANSVGSAPPGGWLRRTYTTYVYQAPYLQSSTLSQAFLTAHIVNKPSQVLVTDGAGIPYSLAQFRYDETPVSGLLGYTNHDDTNYSTSVVTGRGNVTTEQRCALLSHASAVTPTTAASACPQSQWLKTTYTYDLAGQVTSKTDPLLNTTSYSYADNFSEGSPLSSTDGYVTQVTHPLGYIDTYSYSYWSGQMTSRQDWNQQTTNYLFDDPGDMGRLHSVQFPDGGGYSIDYTDTASPSVTVTTTTGEAAGNMVRTTKYDGLGRESQTQLNSDPYGTVLVDTTYDAMGRVYSVSNPYRSKQEKTYGTTVNTLYDALDRVKTKTNADGTSTVKYSFAGNTVTVTDENSNQWAKSSNGLGQMTIVKEPNGTSQSPTMETDYGYDPAGNLLSVKQWGGPNGSPSTNGPIVRSFAYDSVSRLLAAHNPENSSSGSPASLTCTGTSTGTKWTTCYVYDGDGNLKLKTDNRGVSIQYSFDSLNRLTSKVFLNDASQTPISCYQYGSPNSVQGYLAGRLTNAWTQYASSGSCVPPPAPSLYLTLRTVTAYDKMGRIKSQQQCTPSNCASMSPYVVATNYDLMGNLTSYTNGLPSTPGAGSSPLTFSQSYDAAGRLQAVTSTWANQQLFSAQQPQSTNSCSDPAALFPYTAFGATSGAVFGNGVTLVRGFDKRLRTTCENDNSGTGSTGAYSTGMITIKGVEQSK